MRLFWDLRRAIDIGWIAYLALKQGENVVLNTSPATEMMHGCTLINCKWGVAESENDV